MACESRPRGLKTAPAGPAGRGMPQPSRYLRRIDTDKETPAAAADPAADWWTMADIAAFLSSRSGRTVKVASVRRYRARPRKRGGLPPEDRMFGRTPVWRPQTIIRWQDRERRGQGFRSDRVPGRPPAVSNEPLRQHAESGDGRDYG